MKPKLMINASVPGNICNLKCSYCYAKTNDYYPAKYDYPVEHIIKALSHERLGGIAYISFCSNGETLFHEETIDIIAGCVNMGHLVCVVSNCTMTDKIDLLISKIKPEMLKNFCLRGSYHYLELKRTKLLDTYFNNLKKVIDNGGNAYPYLVLSNDYIPYIDELINCSLEKIQAKPHATPCLDFSGGKDFFMSKFYDKELQASCESKFESKILKRNTEIVSINSHKHFCYAGKMSFVLLLQTGDIMKCYNTPITQNIFKNINEPIILEPIGFNCGFSVCGCYHEMQGFGIQPDLNYETLKELYERTNLFNPEFLENIDEKIINDTNRLSPEEEKVASKKCRDLYTSLTKKDSKFKTLIKKIFRGK